MEQCEQRLSQALLHSPDTDGPARRVFTPWTMKKLGNSKV